MKEKLKEILALWIKTSKAGKTYMSGIFTCPSCLEKTRVSVFTNGYKSTDDNKPDYNGYESIKREPPKERWSQKQQSFPSAAQKEPSFTEDDIPF